MPAPSRIDRQRSFRPDATQTQRGRARRTVTRRPVVERLDAKLLLSAGELDPTFGLGGKVLSDIPGTPNAPDSLVAVAPDGKVVQAATVQDASNRGGSQILLARYLSDGTPDSSFDSDGLLTSTVYDNTSTWREMYVWDLAVQGDGKLLVSIGNALVRFREDGQLDQTFNPNGETLGVSEHFPENFGSGRGSILATGDKILVVGQRINQIAVVRYNLDGTLDTGFGTGGMAVSGSTSFYGGANNPVGAAVQPDGGIVVAGNYSGGDWFDYPLGATSTSGSHLIVLRFQADGTPDPNFGPNPSRPGAVLLGVPPAKHLVLTGGRIVVVSTDSSLTALDGSGHLDTTFDGDGRAALAAGSGFTIQALPEANGFVVLGVLTGGSRGYTLAHYDTDSTGAVVGSLVTQSNGLIPRTAALAGSDLVVSYTSLTTDVNPYGGGFLPGTGLAWIRLGDGTLDSQIKGTGTVPLPYRAPMDNLASRVAVQSDGKLLAIGTASPRFIIGNDALRFAIERFNPDGSLDTTFGVGGRQTIDFPVGANYQNPYNLALQHAVATGVVVQGDGKIVLVGRVSRSVYDHGDQVGLVRLTSSGELDTTFGTSGRVLFGGFTRGSQFAPAIALTSEDGLLVSGDMDGGGLGLARFSKDGQQDMGFGASGIARVNIGQATGAAISNDVSVGLVVQTEGANAGKAVMAATSFQEGVPAFALVRFDTNGVPDATSFGSGGVRTFRFDASSQDYALSLARDGGDGLVVVGDTYRPDLDRDAFGVARVTADGQLDTSFDGDGLTTLNFGELFATQFPVAHVYDWANSVVVQPDGRIVVGGRAYAASDDYGQEAWGHFTLSRLNGDGSLDATFGAGGRLKTDFGIDSVGSSYGANLLYQDLGWIGHGLSGLAVQADGRIVTSGFVPTLAGGYDFALARYEAGALVLAGMGQAEVSRQIGALLPTVSQAGLTAAIRFEAADNDQLTRLIRAVNRYDAVSNADGLHAGPVGSMTITVDLGSGEYGGQTIDLWPGETLVINGASGTTTFVGHSPALIVKAGDVTIHDVAFTNATDAPTILVMGGHLILRDSTIDESSTHAQVAIQATGGTVDLGTEADPGGNVVNVNGAGVLVENTSGVPISAVGAAFTVDAAPVSSSSLSGLVYADFNADGQVDFGENGIADVAIELTGTDFLGNPVHLYQITDADGAYVFLNLQPGHYTIRESQPAGYGQGDNSVGTGGGSVTLDQFDVHLAAGLAALNYNYGERPAATGMVAHGQTAGIGFWNNRNGQALIRSLNGGPSSTQLGAWLAATFPNLFGTRSGSNNLAGRSNSDIAAFFQGRFVLKGEKLDAQVLATALAVYITNATLNDTGAGSDLGFIVESRGVGTASFDVGTNGAAFGVADGSVLTVMDLLLAVDERALDGVLYVGEPLKRKKANAVFGAINQVGGI